MGEPSYARLRRYYERTHAMLTDPDCTGDLLLVGLALAHADARGAMMGSSIHAICQPLLSDYRGHLRGVLRGDIRRYEMPMDTRARCGAPMIRRPGPCDRSATRMTSVVDLDTGERRPLGACSKPAHREWFQQTWTRNRADVEDTPPPTPCANTGGVLARHFPEINWELIYTRLRPDWTPPPEGDPLPPRGPFTLLHGDGHDDDVSGDGPELMLVEPS